MKNRILDMENESEFDYFPKIDLTDIRKKINLFYAKFDFMPNTLVIPFNSMIDEQKIKAIFGMDLIYGAVNQSTICLRVK